MTQSEGKFQHSPPSLFPKIEGHLLQHLLGRSTNRPQHQDQGDQDDQEQDQGGGRLIPGEEVKVGGGAAYGSRNSSTNRSLPNLPVLRTPAGDRPLLQHHRGHRGQELCCSGGPG